MLLPAHRQALYVSSHSELPVLLVAVNTGQDAFEQSQDLKSLYLLQQSFRRQGFLVVQKIVNWDNLIELMSTIELRKRLLEKIQNTENKELLEEVYRLLDSEAEDIEIFKLSDHQTKAIDEAKQQIKDGQFLTNEQADKEMDEWLSK